jgi:hypothetical protein
MSLPARFKFYEQVRISASRPGTESVVGELGAVFGISGDAGSWSYGVFVLRIEEVWCFDEAELEPTGVYFQRDDFYSGESVRIQVDANGYGQTTH